jgi:predicted nuclease of predicted toxin-antitoxin system
MTYRILVDENTSPHVAELLRGRGYEAAHVSEALEVGVADEKIIDYAGEHGYVVLTHDDDFLLPEYTETVPILYYSDDTLDTYEIADLVDEMIQYVPDPNDLPPITNLSTWE